MKNRQKWLIITAITVIFGLVVSACDNGGNAHTHDWGGWTETTAATCSAKGVETRTCSGCGETETQDISAGHDWNKTLETISEGVEAITCKRVNCNEKKDYAFQYAIGDTGPAGGIIFYVADDTDGRSDGITIQGYTGATGSFAQYTAYYLEAAPANTAESGIKWSNTNVYIPNLSLFSDTTDWAIGRGRLNTAIIAAAHSSDTTANNAAKAAAAYSNGGKDDWFLPSREELNQMSIIRSYVSLTTGFFWSSSQSNANAAWYQYFFNDGYNDGGRSDDGKFNTLFVRAIRAF